MSGTEPTTCVQCGATLEPGQGVTAQGRRFCQACFDELAKVVRGAVAAQSADIPYPLAVAGALCGGVVGALAWYLFVVATGISWGLIALVIGWAVGKGITLATGGKRALPLQYLSAAVSLGAFLVATYFVNTHLFGPEHAFLFGLLDVVFGAITVWEGWTAVRPLRLA